MIRRALEHTFTQADFNRFAALSGDANPIHVDAGFAARTRFGRTVAHGVLLETVLRGLADKLAPDMRVVEQALRFSAPTFAEEPMRFEAWEEEAGADCLRLGLRVARMGDGTQTCDGHLVLAAVPRASSIAIAGALAEPRPAPVGPLTLGMEASLAQSFSAEDIAAYTTLGGHAPAPGLVPEPLVGALFSTLLGMGLPGIGTNYLKQETTHHAPARTNERLMARVEIIGLRPEKHLVDLATLCHGSDGRLIAEGRALVYVRDVSR